MKLVSAVLDPKHPRPDRRAHSAVPRAPLGGKTKAPRILSLLYGVLLVVIATVLGGQGFAGLGPVEVAATFNANATLSTPPSEPLQQWWDLAPEDAIETLEALEADIDDLSPVVDISDGTSLAFDANSFPRVPNRPQRGEPEEDPLAFAIGAGLPRGPPV
jgi:hypothetical protein